MPDAKLNSNTNKLEKNGKRCFTCTKIALSALLPLILGVFTIVYTLQQDSIAKANRSQDLLIAESNREQDQNQTDELRQQTIYDAYINEVSQLLYNSMPNLSNKKLLTGIRIKTLNILRYVNADQKREIILFLYENTLISSRSAENERLDLWGADLTGVQFVQSATFKCELKSLYLPGVLADRSVFDDCQLTNAIFDHASLIGARFAHSKMFGSKFFSTNLTHATFKGNDMFQLNFSSASLVQARFVGQQLNNVVFTNADLLESDLTDSQLSYIRYDRPNLLFGTRLPNGSFSQIKQPELVQDGGAEQMCKDSRKSQWVISSGIPRAVTVENVEPVQGNCYFHCPTGSRLRQSIDIRHFSLIIDSGQAWFNLSAHFNCIQSNSIVQAYVQVEFLSDDNLYEEWRIDSDQNKRQFHHKFVVGQIPTNKRQVIVRFGADRIASTTSLSTNDNSSYCLIDEINIFVFDCSPSLSHRRICSSS